MVKVIHKHSIKKIGLSTSDVGVEVPETKVGRVVFLEMRDFTTFQNSLANPVTIAHMQSWNVLASNCKCARRVRVGLL